MNDSLSWILFGLIFFMACFGLTLGPVVWIYLPEVSQPKILSLATGASWTSCSLVMLLFPIIKKALPGENPAFLFLFFASWGFVSFFINRKYVLETRNKGEKQIFSEYAVLKSFCWSIYSFVHFALILHCEIWKLSILIKKRIRIIIKKFSKWIKWKYNKNRVPKKWKFYIITLFVSKKTKWIHLPTRTRLKKLKSLQKQRTLLQ